MHKFPKNLRNIIYFLSRKSLLYCPKVCYSNLTKIYEKSFQVNPGFGEINLKLNCNCTIQPADSHYFPDSDHVKLILWNKKSENIDPKVNVEILGKKDFVRVEFEAIHSESLCQLFIPIKYDIEAVLENDISLDILNLESDDINITSVKGSIKTKNIKTEELKLSLQEGSILLDGAFQGNLNINGKILSFQAKRIQGTNLCIQASTLDTDIESSYMSNGNIFVERGNLNIRNLHGSTSLHLHEGNLSVNGLHGKLHSIVNEGNLNIHVSQIIGNSLIQLGKGTLDLSFMDLSNKNIEVIAPVLNINSDVELFGSKFDTGSMQKFVTTFKENPTLNANVKSGSVNVSSRDWFSTLGIKSKSDENCKIAK